MKNPGQAREFLLRASIEAGYGNSGAKIKKSENGAHIINYENEEWRLSDVFYGGHPYAGQEVIYQNGRAVWALQYRGWLYDTDRTPSEVYEFLKKVLLKVPSEHPYRGPENFSEGSLTYQNSWRGEFENFAGEETIIEGEQEIYKGLYFGGEVDV